MTGWNHSQGLGNNNALWCSRDKGVGGWIPAKQGVSIKGVNKSIVKQEVESQLQVSVLDWRWVNFSFFLNDSLANLLTTFFQFTAFNRCFILKWRVICGHQNTQGLQIRREKCKSLYFYQKLFSKCCTDRTLSSPTTDHMIPHKRCLFYAEQEKSIPLWDEINLPKDPSSTCFHT